MLNVKGQDIDLKIPFCLRFSEVDAYFIEESENKYLVFALTENNREEVLEPCKKLWSKIKKQVKAINSGESIKYKNDFMKIRVNLNDDQPLNLNDDLPLNKILYIPVLTYYFYNDLINVKDFDPKLLKLDKKFV